jgi:hypothetical protein
MDEKYTKWTKNIPNGRKIFQMTIKYISISHSQALLNIPKYGFLDSKYWYHLATLLVDLAFDLESATFIYMTQKC